MKKLCIATTAVWVIAAMTCPTFGQTLTERIGAIKKQRAAEQQAAQMPTELSPKAKLLQALVYNTLSVDFDQTPAREVFDYFGTTLGINLIVRYNDDAIGHGIDPQTPITLSAEDMFAVEVLELVLEQCAAVEACTWQLHNSFLEVGTKDRLSSPSAREVRVYRIDELIYEPRRFNNAPAVGINHLYPGSGYGGYARPYVGRFSGAYGSGYYGGYPGGYGGSIGPTVATPTTDQRKSQRAQEIVNLIIDTIEPNAWTQTGGEWATIRYHDGSLVISAPDFIHRQINGYPHVPPPKIESQEDPPADTDRTTSTSPPPSAGQP